MDIGQYRKDYFDYNSATELAHFELRTGQKNTLPLEEIFDRYQHLFTLDAIAGISSEIDETPDHRVTEKTALRSLIAGARVGFLENTAKEIISQKSQCDSAARISWQGERISAHQAPGIAANESDAAKRRDVMARHADAMAACNDLRAECLSSFHNSARTLGFEYYRSMFDEAMGRDIASLLASAELFLLATEKSYNNAVAEAVNDFLPDVKIGDLHYSDYLYLQRMRSLDKSFPASGLMSTYSSAMASLGIRSGNQQNIRFDTQPRPTKNPRAACFRVRVPEDVRVSLCPVGGSYDYTVMFHEAGHAQHFAWSSKSIVDRYPEFVFPAENGTTEGFAFLFHNLFQDPAWIREHRPGTSPEQAREISRRLTLLTAFTIRRYCGKLKYELSLHASESVRTDSLAQLYVDAQVESTLFRREPSLYLSDVDDGFYAAAYLRAWAFEAGLRDHLKTRYGSNWWASRKAGDELVDLWNTASQYKVEELAQLIGFGPLSFELLAETINKALRKE